MTPGTKSDRETDKNKKKKRIDTCEATKPRDPVESIQ